MSNITDRLGGARSSLAIKAPVRCATTANITLSGFQTIDDEVLAATDGNLRVLVKSQTDARENGIYVASSGLWQRSRDFDGNLDIMKGTRVYVTDGTENGNRAWVISSDDPLTIGTSNIEFVQPTDEISTPSIPGMDEDTANDDVVDFLAEYDVSAADYKKVKVANLGFTQSGTHGVLRKMKSKIADHRDILDYLSESQAASAIAGTLDMTPYLQWMLDELPSSKGAVTFKRAGNYLFQRQAGNAFGVTIGSNRQIVFDRGVRLKTEGLAVGVNGFSAIGALFRNSTMTGSGNENIVIEGGEFQVNAASAVYGGSAFFAFKNVRGLRLIGQRCLDTIGSCRMQMANCQDVFVSEYIARYTGEVALTLQPNQSASVYEFGDAIRFGSGCRNVLARGLRLDSGDDAIALNNEPSETDGSTTGLDIRDIEISDAIVTTQRGHALRVYQEATMTAGSVYNIFVNGLNGTVSHVGTNAGISLADYSNGGAGRTSIYDITFSNIQLDVSNVVGDGVLFLNTDKIRMSNSRIVGCDRYGINCNNAAQTYLDNLILYGTSGSTDGVLFANGSDSSHIRGGQINGFGQDNVHIESADCRVSDMVLSSPGRANIYMTGASCLGTQIGSNRHSSSTAFPVVQESGGADYTVCMWQDTRGCTQGVDTGSRGANSLYVFNLSGTLGLSSGFGISAGGTGATTAAGARASLAVAPNTATFITQTASSELSGEQALSALATGIVKNTTGTGVLSIATAGTDYYNPGGTDVAIADGGTGASTASQAATNLGLGTGDTPLFTGVNIGAADTTITRAAAGDIAVEGNAVYRAGGTDIPITDGGTGASTAAQARINLGVGTSDSPEFAAINLGAATDTTVTRVSAGVMAVEGETVHTNSTARTATVAGIEVGHATDTTVTRTAAGIIAVEGETVHTNSTARTATVLGIEVGHATDTTVTRASAGNIAVEGNLIYRAGGTDVPVADGGTGVSSLTAYGVLCGGTTTTGAIQALAGLGTSGQVLTSNGAAALPSFQNAAGGGGAAAAKNRLTNGCMRINQRGSTTVADDVYCFDRWYALTQTSTITIGQQTNIADGWPYAIRLTQAQASAQRMGLAQIIESADCIDMRGQSVTLSAKVQMSASTTLRYAILEWTGTANAVTSDWVNDWTSATFTAGNFFKSTTTTVAGTGSTALTANTATDVSLTASISSSANNVAVMVWTDSTQAQNVTLDIGEVQLETGSTANTFEWLDISDVQHRCDRYYQSYGGDDLYEFFTAGVANSTGTGYFPMNLRNFLRAPPAIGYSNLSHIGVGYQGGGIVGISSVSIGQASKSKPYIIVNTSSAVLTAGDCVVFQANNSTSARLTFDSEL